jgi:hypothetical protein
VVRTYLERCKQVAPWFPPPYNYLGQYYFNAGLRDKSEENLVRYGEIYPPGVEGSWHMMLARIALDDTTRDRFAEVSRHLKASDNLQASMYLADLFIERQQPDSALSELLPHRQRMRWDHNEYSRLMFLTVVAELATGDSVSAFAALDTLKFNRRRTNPGVDQFYDYALELEKSLKK